MLIRVAAQAVHRWQLHPRPDAAQALTSSRTEVEVEVAGVRILRVPITESTIFIEMHRVNVTSRNALMHAVKISYRVIWALGRSITGRTMSWHRYC